MPVICDAMKRIWRHCNIFWFIYPGRYIWRRDVWGYLLSLHSTATVGVCSLPRQVARHPSWRLPSLPDTTRHSTFTQGYHGDLCCHLRRFDDVTDRITSFAYVRRCYNDEIHRSGVVAFCCYNHNDNTAIHSKSKNIKRKGAFYSF